MAVSAMYSWGPWEMSRRPAALGEGRDPDLRVPAGGEHTGGQLEARAGGFDGLDTPSERLARGVALLSAAGGLRLEHLDLDVGAGGFGRFFVVPVNRASSWSSCSSGLRRRSMETRLSRARR